MNRPAPLLMRINNKTNLKMTRPKNEGELILLWNDIGFALRMMRRTPVFTAAVVLTVTLAIGAGTVIFSVVNAVMLRPLPFHDPVSRWLPARFPRFALRESIQSCLYATSN